MERVSEGLVKTESGEATPVGRRDANVEELKFPLPPLELRRQRLPGTRFEDMKSTQNRKNSVLRLSCGPV